ncbi:hypothetical protein Sjap_010779 [Stephania japonica]|uniref:Uncharacterized protein n=1 Tax=Stephania japonica TaxID=461633 RepID=A0AAP0JCA1_9MAGN|nr:COMT protein [Stephania japonica]
MASTNYLQKPNNNNNNNIVNGDGGGDDETFLFAEQLVYGALVPMVMRAAIKLSVFEILSRAPTAYLSASEIASQLSNNKNPDAHIILDRLLRFLASHSVLTCITQEINNTNNERLYGLAPVCKYFIKNEDGASLCPSLLFANGKISLDSWSYFHDTVLNPDFSAVDEVCGMDAYEYLAKDEELNELFNRSMSHETTIVMKKILNKYEGFDGLKVVVDVGGGVGTNIRMIVSKYPTIKGINFDLPRVIETASSYPGVEHVGGDMFVSVPKGDAIFMKLVLHNWKDEECVTLLKMCHEALPERGKVIVVEGIVPEVPEPDNATRHVYGFDIMMMATKAKERTEKEFQVLAKESGFASMKMVCKACNFWVIEFLK